MKTSEEIKFVDIPPQKTFLEAGLDAFGQSPLKFVGVEVNKKSFAALEQNVSPNFIQSGDLIQKFTLTDGFIQSGNYEVGVSGWILYADGTKEFN